MLSGNLAPYWILQLRRKFGYPGRSSAIVAYQQAGHAEGFRFVPGKSIAVRSNDGGAMVDNNAKKSPVKTREAKEKQPRKGPQKKRPHLGEA
jgi:hypothetical protein